MTYRKISLKVVTAPATGLVLHAPPVLAASDHSVDYTCGRCGTILLHAEENHVTVSYSTAQTADRIMQQKCKALRSIAGLQNHLLRSGRGPARHVLAALAIISPARRP